MIHGYPGQRRPMGGFTLIELLIALALVALLITLMFGGLRLGGRSWESGDRKAEQVVEMRMVWRFLNDQLSQTVPVVYDAGEGEALLIAGREDAMEFVAPMPEHLGIGGYYILRLQKAGGRLVLSRWLFNPEVMEGGQGIPPWESLADGGRPAEGEDDGENRAYYSRSDLVDRLKGVEIDYFGAGEGETEPDWKEKWEEKELPLLVRIRIKTEARDWPEMVFRVGV